MTRLKISQLPEKYRKMINISKSCVNNSKYHVKRVEIEGYKFDKKIPSLSMR